MKLQISILQRSYRIFFRDPPERIHSCVLENLDHRPRPISSCASSLSCGGSTGICICICTGYFLVLVPNCHFCALWFKLNWFPPIVEKGKDLGDQFSLNTNTRKWVLGIGRKKHPVFVFVFVEHPKLMYFEILVQIRLQTGEALKCLYTILLMAVYWMTEALPLPITSMIPMVRKSRWKGHLFNLFLGGIAASGNYVYKGGCYKLPEWHELYGEFSCW